MSDQSSREFTEGMSAIEQKMRSLLDDNGGGGASLNLVWNHGKEIDFNSSSIELFAELDGREVAMKFSREQVEDAWGGVVVAGTKAVVQEGARRIRRS